MLPPPVLFVVLPVLVDHAAASGDVAQPVEHEGLGRFAVPPRPPQFLVIGFHAAGQGSVQHVANVGLVDSHPEGDGCRHDHPGAGHELILHFGSFAGGHTGVVGGGVYSRFPQLFGGLFGVFAGQAVDDAALPGPGPRVFRDPFAAGGFLHRQMDVGPVEPVDEHPASVAEQFVGDVAAGGFVGGGGESPDGRPRQASGQVGQGFVFGAESRSPFGDAVGFVHHRQFHLHRLQQVHHMVSHQPFRGQVEQERFALLGGVLGLVPNVAVFLPGMGGVDGPGRYFGQAQARHLVFHQGDERRHHQGQTPQQQGGYLVAEGFARPGGHHRQHVYAVGQGADHFFLPRTERVEPEHFPQRPPGSVLRPVHTAVPLRKMS